MIRAFREDERYCQRVLCDYLHLLEAWKVRYPVYDGHHEAIISEELWKKAQAKKNANGRRNEVVEKDHQYIFSALLKCPVCGKSLYGVPMRGRKRKDGSTYPTYYSYACRSHKNFNGIECGFGQIPCRKVDKAMEGIISQIINKVSFGQLVSQQVGKQIDTVEIEQELDTATKAQRQALGLQRKLESELDRLDVTDKHYDRKYESLNRRLDEAFDAVEEVEKKIADCEARIEAVNRQRLSKESIFESLKIYDNLYSKMNDYEKKSYVRTFIESIDLYPDKKGKNGSPSKNIHFRFAISYNGESVYDFSPPISTTDETVVCLGNKNAKPKDYVEIGW